MQSVISSTIKGAKREKLFFKGVFSTYDFAWRVSFTGTAFSHAEGNLRVDPEEGVITWIRLQ